jgi:hypothetical protein
MDLGRVPALGGPPALIVSAFFFLLDFLDLDLDLALALAFNIFAIMIHPCFLTGLRVACQRRGETTRPRRAFKSAAGVLVHRGRQSMINWAVIHSRWQPFSLRNA